MIITCLRYQDARTTTPQKTIMFRSEDFYFAESGAACVDVAISRGDKHFQFYVSHDEWQRIAPLLVSPDAAPALPQNVIEAYDEYQRMLSLTGVTEHHHRVQLARIVDAIAIARAKDQS